MINRILLLCTANICRSPMAEAVFHRATGGQRRAPEIRSAGVHALVGHPVAEDAQQVLEGRGLDMSEHRATQLTPEMLAWADLVLIMEEAQRSAVRAIGSAYVGKVMRLGHWADSEITDPYLQGLDACEQTLQLIEASVAGWAGRLH
ncbi:hypothetical protein CKO31_23345 [Thiohalocapsa halophila]|uniref:protein-tyrosine-phosphatase n=1 Tax=Thiohalocapsa halophila TaxID=69359 RepID=A0ABS1CQI8_9GAMM|nr:low molecular weight protein-tyrosine-phosphatase [Thiohalocapsa halophila]MBK1633626.1 hypothetical protein [Thiohalocapsa halophila]